MSGDQAKRNVETVSRGLLDAAKMVRQKAVAVMLDERLTLAERVEGKEGLEKMAIKFEAQAKWWKTGEGRCP